MRHDISLRYMDANRSRMILLAHICRMQRRHFLMPSTQSKSCEKRAVTRMICIRRCAVRCGGLEPFSYS
jgi:hypothetical protein